MDMCSSAVFICQQNEQRNRSPATVALSQPLLREATAGATPLLLRLAWPRPLSRPHPTLLLP